MRVLLLFFISSLSTAYSSAKVCLSHDKIIIYSKIHFYGDNAASFYKKCTSEISSIFNSSSLRVRVGEKEYQTMFLIKGLLVSADDAISIARQKRIEDNFVRIETKANNQKDGRSNFRIDRNQGFFASNDDLGESRTCAHEYGHGLGLKHYDESASYKNARYIPGRPGIMAPRGTKVDSLYAYPGTQIMDPSKRHLKLSDLMDLQLETLSFDKFGCARLGRFIPIIYDQSGSALYTH